MLIAISGSQGSGKSTVIDQLSDRNYSVIKRKTSRSILNDWGVTLAQVNNDHKLTIKFQDEILKRKIKDEYNVSADCVSWITERSMIDLLVYALFALGKDNEYAGWMQEYYQKLIDAQKMYSAVILLSPIGTAVENDGIRGINRLYQDSVATLLTKYTIAICDKLNIPILHVNITSLTDRVNIVDNFILTQVQQS